MNIKPNYYDDTKNDYSLELCDFDYLKDEFTITKDALGFKLESKFDDKLCIKINSNSIFYDRDISTRRMMIATERVDVYCRILTSIGNDPHEYKKYLPTTTIQLIGLIDEYKYSSMGEIKDYDISYYLKFNK